MLLILTSHDDSLVNQLLPDLAEESIFRFNIEDWRSYSWRFTPESYSLTSPEGVTCYEDQISAVWLRPWQFSQKEFSVSPEGSLGAWGCREVEQVIAGICDLAMHAGKLLTGMKRSIAWSPIYQLRMAAKHFAVPMWEILKGEEAHLKGKVLAKAQTKTLLTEGRSASTRIYDMEESQIDFSYPWFLQEYLADVTHSVTVSHVEGKSFAYQQEQGRDAASLKEKPSSPMEPYTLSPEQEARMDSLLQDLELSIAHFHFTLQADNTLSCISIQPFLHHELHSAERARLTNKIHAAMTVNQ